MRPVHVLRIGCPPWFCPKRPSAGTVVTLASGFNGPSGVAVDGSGNVFVVDSGNNLVKEILAADGTVVTLADGFNYPHGVAVDGRGNVFVADQNNNAIKEILAPPVPTLGTWALVLPGLLLGAAGVVAARRRMGA